MTQLNPIVSFILSQSVPGTYVHESEASNCVIPVVLLADAIAICMTNMFKALKTMRTMDRCQRFFAIFSKYNNSTVRLQKERDIDRSFSSKVPKFLPSIMGNTRTPIPNQVFSERHAIHNSPALISQLKKIGIEPRDTAYRVTSWSRLLLIYNNLAIFDHLFRTSCGA